VFSGGKGGRCVRLTTLPPSCAVVMKSGNLNFLEPSGPLQSCNGTTLPFIVLLPTILVVASCKACVCGRLSAGIACSNPTAYMDTSSECCVLLCRGLCVGLMTRPQKYNRVWCECDRETSIMRTFWPTGGCSVVEEIYIPIAVPIGNSLLNVC
jgi:hypothetical protein